MSIRYATYQVALGAGEVVDLAVSGTAFRVVEADGDVRISVDERGTGVMQKGMGFEVGEGAVPFDNLRLENPGGSSIDVTLGVATGQIQDSRASFVQGSTVATQETKGDHATPADHSVAATSTEEVLAANSARREAWITNLDGNSDPVRVGDANAGAARGIQVKPGETAVIQTKGAVHVYNAGSVAQSVALMEVTD